MSRLIHVAPVCYTLSTLCSLCTRSTLYTLYTLSTLYTRSTLSTLCLLLRASKFIQGALVHTLCILQWGIGIMRLCGVREERRIVSCLIVLVQL
jgi:hypothetical protein